MTHPQPEALSDAELDECRRSAPIFASSQMYDGGFVLRLLATIASERALREVVEKDLAACRASGAHMAWLNTSAEAELAAVNAQVAVLVEAVKAAQEMHETLSAATSQASCDTQDNESEPWERLVHGFWFDGLMASYRDTFEEAIADLPASATALLERVTRMEGALKPFADQGANQLRDNMPSESPVCLLQKAGDYRRAREALRP